MSKSQSSSVANPFVLAVRICLVIGFCVVTAHSDAIPPKRSWQDEVIYVIVTEKFFDGNRANDFMLGRYEREKSHYEGGLCGVAISTE